MAAIDFPSSPTTGQTFTVSGVTWKYDGAKWAATPPVAVADAPSDGSLYGRLNGAWSSGGSISGSLAVVGGVSLVRASFVNVAVAASGPTALDRSAGEVQKISVNANCSFSVSNWPASGNFARMILDITNTGAFTVSGWPAGTKWAGGSAPVITSGAGKRDVIILMTLDGGTTVLGSIAGQDYR